MKVKELLAKLAECDPESEVICQKDSEGNGYSPLSDIDNNSVYVAETPWNGQVFSMEDSPDDAGLDASEWADIIKHPLCVVLFPTN
jgi:hypothetical protein